MRLVVLPLLGLAVLLGAGLRIRRYSPGHVAAQLTLAGRGLYFSRTPDGDWWKLRLRRRCTPTASGTPPDDPPGAGVRETRRPPGPQPLSAGARAEPG
jgi:hypothetical protein